MAQLDASPDLQDSMKHGEAVVDGSKAGDAVVVRWCGYACGGRAGLQGLGRDEARGRMGEDGEGDGVGDAGTEARLRR